MEAVSRKVKISPTVDLEDIALDAEGFSGADLQALVYNAHLEVVHETIAAAKLESSEHNPSRRRDSADEIGPVQYTIIGGSAGGPNKVLTRAEEDSMQRKLRRMVANTMREPGKSDDVSSDTQKRPPIQVRFAYMLCFP